AAAVEPGDGTFDDPAFWENCESLDTIGAPDNLGLDVRQHASQGLVEGTPLIGSVSKELGQERMHPEHGGEQEDAAITILDRRDERWRAGASPAYLRARGASCP